MRNWLKIQSEIDKDCIYQWEKLLRIKFESYEEYCEVDKLINDMILDYENLTELKREEHYPDIRKDALKILENMRKERKYGK